VFRIETRTKLTPREVVERAVAFFGSYGLAVTRRSDTEVLLEGGGGSIDIFARPEGKETVIEILSREWDQQAREFAREIG